MQRAEPPASLWCLGISPDGNSIIYEQQDKPKEPYRILSRDLSTGEEKQLYTTGDRTQFSISPDGRWLALINEAIKKVVQVMPTSGGQPKELLRYEEEEEASGYVGQIEWTADGKYILFPRLHQMKDGNKFALWRIASEGGKAQQLNLVMANFQALSAHPDGQHLLLIRWVLRANSQQSGSWRTSCRRQRVLRSNHALGNATLQNGRRSRYSIPIEWLGGDSISKNFLPDLPFSLAQQPFNPMHMHACFLPLKRITEQCQT